MWQDLRYGARMLARKPGFTLVAVLTLALGIGANTALFSVVDGVLLKKLPVAEPDRLVIFKSLAGRAFSPGGYNGNSRPEPSGMTARTSFPYQFFARLRAEEGLPAEVFAFARLGQLNVGVDGQAAMASGQIVSGNYYAVLGVQALYGRTIGGGDDAAAAGAVAVISHRYWQQAFAGDPAVVGQQITVNGVAVTVVGVAPPEFAGTMQVGSSPDISVPLALEPRVNAGRSRMAGAGQWWLVLMGRLRPGATAEQARASLEGIFEQAVLEHRAARQSQGPATLRLPPLEPKDYPRLAVDPGGQGQMDLRRHYAPQLYVLLGVVGLVLLISCANVANLLLARTASRRQEIAVRLAMGGSRRRLIQQLLTESALLSALGGVLGLIFALWVKDVLLSMSLSGGEGMGAFDPRLDLRVLSFTVALSVVTAVVFGLAPALRATKLDLTPALKDSARGSGFASRSWLTRSLVVAQVAMSLLLLVGAGLCLRTLSRLQQVDVGFNRHHLLLFGVDPNLVGYQGDRLAGLYRQMFERIGAVPGVRSVTFSRETLLSGGASDRDVFLPGEGAVSASRGEARLHRVSESYFGTMEIPLALGRGLSSRDDERAPRVVVVNQAFARHYFPNENPVGKRFGFNAETAGQIEIVGVAGDAKYTSLREEVRPTVYVPWAQELGSVGSMTFVVRTSGDPASSVAAVRQAVREVDPRLPLADVKTQAEQADQSLATERMFARLLSFFGLLALLLASVGLYGVLAYSVVQRTREIGIRMALGGQPRDVMKMIVGQGMGLALVGVAIGLTAAAASTRVLASLLYGVSATDPLTFGVIALLLTLVALLACWIPARRATKLDPLAALRSE